MANEFKVKNGLIVVGDLTTSGTITINGALAATQSWVTSQAYLTSASLSGYATQSYVTSAISALIDAAPAALDTLNELAAALGDDASFSTTVTNSIAGKVAKSGDTMTGSLTFASTADNVRLQKNSSFLNLRDPWNNIHLYNAGDGTYIDATVHFWRSQAGTHWVALNSTGLGIGTTSPNSVLDIRRDGGSSTNPIPLTSWYGGNGGGNLVAKLEYTADAGIFTIGYAGLASWDSIVLDGGNSNGGSSIALKNDTVTTVFLRSSSGNNYINSGSLGIGTTTPYAGTNVTSLDINATAYPVLALSIGSSYVGGMTGFSNHVAVSAKSGNYITLEPNDTEAVRITNAGRVGIGTTSPAKTLVVNGETWINLTSDYFGGGTTVQISSGGTGAVGIQSNTFYLYPYSSDTATNLIYGYNGTASWNLNNGGNNRFNFYSYGGGITVMSLTSGGKVGIGTTSPAGKLSIEGDGTEYSNIVFKQSAAQEHLIYASLNYQYNLIGSGSPVWIWGQQGGSERMRLDNTNLGIGTTSPSQKLHIYGSGDQALFVENSSTYHIYTGLSSNVGYVGSNNATPLSLRTNGNSRLYIDTSGNVGIGTTSPSYKLDVSGTARFTQSITLNQSAVVKKRFDSGTNNPVKTASGVLTSRSDNASGSTYYVIETNVPQDEYQMGGFTIELFGNYSSTNHKTKIDLGGYWNPEGNGGFIGFEAHGSNPQYKPTIEVARNTSTGNTAFIIYGLSWNYPVIVARDLWLGYNGTDGGAYGEGWSIIGTETISGYSNRDTVVWRNAYSDSNPAGYITGYTETDTLQSVTSRGATTNTLVSLNAGLRMGNAYLTPSGDQNHFHFDGTAIIPNSSTTANNASIGTNTYRWSSVYGGYGYFSENVGIGTTSPSSKLTVYSDTTADGILVDVLSRPRITLRDRGNSDTILGTGDYGLDDFFIDTYSGNAFAIKGSTRNVGIGTTNPIYKLQVVGSAYVNGGTLFLDSSQYLRWGNSNQGIVGVNDDHVAIVSGGATRQSIYADGRTYFPGLDLSISNVNSSHGTGTYFRGSSSHFVLGLTDGNTLYLNYGNPTGTIYSYGVFNHAGVLNIGGNAVATQTWVQSQGYLTSVSWSSITGKPYLLTLNYDQGSSWAGNTGGSGRNLVASFHGASGNSVITFGSSNGDLNLSVDGNVYVNEGQDILASRTWVTSQNYITSSGSISGNAATATTFSTGRTNYKGVTDSAVAGQLMWKNYGNNHTIFDASQGTSPDGTSVNNTNSQVAWTGSYPTLMGWNGSTTYGVRVDSARVADSATIAGALTSMNISQFTNNSGYVAYGNYSWTSPVFGQYGIKSNLVDNVLYSAADRFEVFKDGVAWNTNSPFNLNYDQSCDVIPVNTSRTYSIVLNTKGNPSYGIVYTEGYVYLSFYYVQIPASVSGRVRRQNGTWENISGWTNVANNGSYAVWRGNVPGGNWMVEIEITINSGSSVATWFAQWEYVMGRPGQYELGIINKAQDNSLWRNLYFRDSSNNVQVSIGASGLSTSQNLHISGTSALYFPSYGGGFYMQDSSWIRTVNYKSIWTQTGLLGTDGGLTVGYGGTTPPSGGAIISGNVGIGATSLEAKLHVVSGASQAGILSRGVSGDTWFPYSNGQNYVRGVTNFDLGSVYFTGGNIGIGTSSPASLLHVYNNADVWHTRIGGASGELRIGGQTSSGAVIQAYTPGGSVRQLYLQRDGGNVGIGTNSPTAILEINGAGGDGSPSLRIISATSDTFNWASSTQHANLTAGETSIHLIGKANSQYNQAYFGYRHVSDGSSSNMLTLGLYAADYLVNILGNGNVGVGTTSPSQKLHVVGNQYTSGDILLGSSGSYNKLRFYRYEGSAVGGMGWDSTDSAFYIGGIPDWGPTAGNIVRVYGFGQDLRLGNAIAGDVMTINTSANVGIGTTSPSTKLEVGNFLDAVTNKITVAGRYEYEPEFNFRLGQSGTNFDWVGAVISSGDDGNYNGKILFKTADANRQAPTTKMVIKANGNVGIGTTSPQSKLHIETSSSNPFRMVRGTTNFGFEIGGGAIGLYDYEDSIYRWYVDSVGNIGIGTSSPSEKLHVSGASVFDGGSGNSSTDAVVYITKSTNDDWGLYVNNAGLDYGMYTRVSGSAGYAFAIHNGTTWTTRITGDGRVHLNNKDTIASYDSWLRLNQSGEYASGVYTPGLMRADGGFQVSGSTVWHAGNDGSGSGLDADLLDGQDSSTFLRILSGGSEANLDSYTDNGVRSVSFTGHSQHLLSWNVGGSTGTVQQLFHYGVPNNGWKIRNKTDNSSWSDWGYVVMASSNQGLISGTIATQSWVGSQSYATTSYVTTQINNLINGAPGALDTLDELAAALGDDSNFATTVTNSIAGKVSKSGDTMTGALTLNGGLNAYAQPIFVNEIKFRDTAGSPQSDPYSIRWISETSTRGAGNSWLEFQLNDDNNEEIRIYGNSCVGYGCGTYSDNLYHRFRADGYAWHGGNLVVVGTISASGYNSGNWDTAYGWGNHASAGYALNSALANYLPLSGGSIGGALTVNGNLTVNGTITENSSLKVKENVETSEGNLEKVVNLRPVTYNKIGSQTTELGLIAEEVAEVYPEFVQYDENGDPVGVHYSRLTAALIGAVKELTNQVQELNKKING